jgi:hypothetical protein
MVGRRTLILCGVFVMVLHSCGGLERPIERYQSYRELEARGDFDAAWFPTYLPREAVNITAAHDIDMNTAWLSFHIPPSALESFAQGVEPAREWELPGRPPDADSWWPAELTRQHRSTNSDKKNFEVFEELEIGRLRGMNTARVAYFAVSRQSAMVYFWVLRY